MESGGGNLFCKIDFTRESEATLPKNSYYPTLDI